MAIASEELGIWFYWFLSSWVTSLKSTLPLDKKIKLYNLKCFILLRSHLYTYLEAEGLFPPVRIFLNLFLRAGYFFQCFGLKPANVPKS